MQLAGQFIAKCLPVAVMYCYWIVYTLCNFCCSCAFVCVCASVFLCSFRNFWARKRVSKRYERCSSCCSWGCCYQICNLQRLFRPPGRSNGRTYKMLVMFSFFSRRNLRAPSADHRETWPHDRNRCLFYKLTPKIRGALPLKKLGAKNMQNFGRLYTTSNFDLEYLRNGSRYPKTES